MNKKIRKVIGIISILFIIGMFLVKGLNNYSDRSFSNLSGGEKQRTLIARALVQNTDLSVFFYYL